MDEKTAIAEQRVFFPMSGIAVDAPWIFIERADNPTIAFDVRALDRLAAVDCKLVLAIGDITVTLEVLDGADAAAMMVDKLAGHTRHSKIRNEAECSSARDFLQLLDSPLAPLRVGTDRVLIKDGYVEVGVLEYAHDQVQRQAQHGGDLAVVDGWVQASLVLIAVEVSRIRDYRELVSRRIREFEDATKALGY